MMNLKTLIGLAVVAGVTSANAAITITINTDTETISASGSITGTSDIANSTVHSVTFGNPIGGNDDVDVTSLFSSAGYTMIGLFQFAGGVENTFEITAIGVGNANDPITVTGGGSVSYSGLSSEAKTELESIASPTNVPVQNGTFTGPANDVNIVVVPAVPEPSSVMLLSLSGAFVLGRRKRK